MPLPKHINPVKDECDQSTKEEAKGESRGYPILVFFHGGTFIADMGTAPYIDGEAYNNVRFMPNRR